MGRVVGRRLWLAAVVVCVAVIGATPAAALAAAGEHEFNPELSLTGSCKTDFVDPVVDPGLCPIPPGVLGVDHPEVQFTSPRAITTDSHGNIYVGTWGTSANGGKGGRVDIFDSEGFFIEGLEVEGAAGLAVDSDGVLYAVERPNAFLRVSRRTPCGTYDPAEGEIEYCDPPVVVAEDFIGSRTSIAVNPQNDHLFILYGNRIVERSSGKEGNAVVGEISPLQDEGISIAIDATRNRLYSSDTPGSTGVIRVFELSAPHNLIDTIEGLDTPDGDFGVSPSIAADEGTGNIFVYDGGEDGSRVVEEFDEDGSYLSSIEYGMKDLGNAIQIWVDNGAKSPNGAANPFGGRFLFVPSHPTGLGHALAFGPSGDQEPEIGALSAAEVTRDDAELRATINPGNLPTDYTFEYITQQRYEEEGSTFNAASVAGSGLIPAGQAGVPVSAAATGLSPGTTYRFRVVAANDKSRESETLVSAEGEFTTYLAATPSPSCSNDPFRIGVSSLLPDCRAYELVTPAATNARSPVGQTQLGVFFPTLQASPAGDKVSFQTQGGTLPGEEGTGSFGGDPYLATRTSSGWSSASVGPTGEEVGALLPGSQSPDQGYSIWAATGEKGSAVVPGGEQTNYVRYPDGHKELVGRGSLEVTDPRAEVRMISENGGHIVFISGTVSGPPIQLEPNAPPSGTSTIYDRTSDEVTHVVSLLPEDKTPAPGEDALYQGASYDGEGVAFKIGDTLYLRHDNDETYAVGSGVTFAGVAEGGERIFYLEGGDLKAFDIEDGVIFFSTTGDVTPVNVAAEGTAAYFVSPSAPPGEPNPNGAEPQAGKENLYLSREGQLSFVGTVTERDVEGASLGIEPGEGLGLWLESLERKKPGIDPSRTTPDGNSLLFESRAHLDGYDPEGHAQVYRFNFQNDELDCLSCNPTGSPASGAGSLQSLNQGQIKPEPLTATNRLTNIRADGRRVFFQSEEPLVPEDTDGLQDVYEWEDQGVGSCTRSGGCVYLISSGQSERIDYLFAVSDNGDDVFFRTSDLLLPADSDETPSIYDARVGGGFAESTPACQQTQICRNSQAAPPSLPAPASGAVGPSGNVASKPKSTRCGKGKRKVKRNGKVRCVKKKQSKNNGGNKRAGTSQKGGRK